MIEPGRRPPLWGAVLGLLRDAILSGEFAGGSKLVERDLAERFGTSRGPIREAIRELSREGLVVELPRRGTIVVTLTARDLAEVYAVREALETAAVRIVVARAADEDLRALAHCVDGIEAGSDYLAVAEHDLAFHRQLVALTANARMIAIYEQMLTQTMLLLRTAAVANPTLRTGLRRSAHQDILDALIGREAGRAQAAISAHYAYAEERLFNAFSITPPTDLSAPRWTNG